jgi:hypothetical protein
VAVIRIDGLPQGALLGLCTGLGCLELVAHRRAEVLRALLGSSCCISLLRALLGLLDRGIAGSIDLRKALVREVAHRGGIAGRRERIHRGRPSRSLVSGANSKWLGIRPSLRRLQARKAHVARCLRRRRDRSRHQLGRLIERIGRRRRQAGRPYSQADDMASLAAIALQPLGRRAGLAHRGHARPRHGLPYRARHISGTGARGPRPGVSSVINSDLSRIGPDEADPDSMLCEPPIGFEISGCG